MILLTLLYASISKPSQLNDATQSFEVNDNNSWSFTKLGHINLSKTELRELLAEEDTVTITIGLK